MNKCRRNKRRKQKRLAVGGWRQVNVRLDGPVKLVFFESVNQPPPS